jgi:hypothetical protein
VETRGRDDQGEEEYERWAEGMPSEHAVAIAVEITIDRHKEEKSLPSKTETLDEGQRTKRDHILSMGN